MEANTELSEVVQELPELPPINPPAIIPKPNNYIECSSCNRVHHMNYTHPQEGYDFKCQRCGHEWRTKAPNTYPKQCSRCHSSYWDVPKLVSNSVEHKVARHKRRVKRQSQVRAKRFNEVVSKSGIPPPPSMRRLPST